MSTASVKGSVSRSSAGEVVSDRGSAIVIDAGNALGQLTARQAVRLAVARAQEIGLAAVGVRNAFHFGTAGRYARMMAAENCVGIVMSNTRPLMPAPGGAAGAGRQQSDRDRAALRGRISGRSRHGAERNRHGQDPARRGGRAEHPGGLGDRCGRPADHRSGRGDQGHAAAGRRPEGLRPRLRHRSPVRRACPAARSARRCARSTAIPPSPIAAPSFFLAIDAGHFPAGERFAERVQRSGGARERVEAQRRASIASMRRASCVWRRGRQTPASAASSRADARQPRRHRGRVPASTISNRHCSQRRCQHMKQQITSDEAPPAERAFLAGDRQSRRGASSSSSPA